MYEMATRRRAFSGDTATVLQDAILNYVPALPRELNPSIADKVENIINKLMVKDRELRYQSSLDVLSDLEGLRRGMKPGRARWWASAAAVEVVVIAGGTWLAVRKDYSPRLPEIRLQQLTLNSSENPVVGGAISPDGRYLEFSDTQGLHLKLLEGGEILTIPQPELLKNQSMTWDRGAWFPDSTSFVVNSYPSKQESNDWNSNNSSVWKVSVLGSAPVELRDQAVAWAVSPDGSTISFGTNGGELGEREAWLMGSSGEQARRLFQADDRHVIDALRWSPDGTRYLYVLLDESGATVVSLALQTSSQSLSGIRRTARGVPSGITPFQPGITSPNPEQSTPKIGSAVSLFYRARLCARSLRIPFSYKSPLHQTVRELSPLCWIGVLLALSVSDFAAIFE
jgi:Tol biopolymer transport system component